MHYFINIIIIIIIIIIILITLCRVFTIIHLKQTMSLRYMQCCSCPVFTVCATCNVISSVKYVLYFYISTFRSMSAMTNTAVFCSPLILCFPGMLHMYCLSDFEMVPVVPLIITLSLSNSTCAEFLLWGLHILKSSQLLSWLHFCLQESQYLLTCMFLSYHYVLWCPVYCYE